MTGRPGPHNIEHSTQIELFGACQCACHRRAGECCCRSTDPQFLPHIEQQRREQQKRDLMRGKPQTIINAVRRGDPQVLGWLNQRRVASRQNTHRIDA